MPQQEPQEMTPAEQADGEARFIAIHQARLIMLRFRPSDVLALMVYIVHTIARMRQVDGHPLTPLLATMRSAAIKCAESITTTPYHRPFTDGWEALVEASDDGDSKASDDGAWGEDFIDSLAVYMPLAPGSLLFLLDPLLHYLAFVGEFPSDPNEASKANPLKLPAPLTLSTKERELAKHLRDNFNRAFLAKMPKAAK